MNQGFVQEMFDKLCVDAKLSDVGKKLILDSLTEFWSDKIALVWCVADVLAQHPLLSDEEAFQVLSTISKDAEFRPGETGVTWKTINDAATMLFGDDKAGSTQVLVVEVDEEELEAWNDLEELLYTAPRGVLMDLLHGGGIQSYDHDSADVLREAVLINVKDGTLDHESVTLILRERQ